MLLLLSIPLRTRINLHPRHAASRTEAFVNAIAAAGSQLAAEHPSIHVQTLSEHDQDGRSLYTHIDEDFIPACVQALFTLDWSAPPTDSEAGHMQPPVASSRIEKATVHYYDHTIAILELQLRLSDMVSDPAQARALDQWSVDLAKAWLRAIDPITEAIEEHLAQGPEQRALGVPIAEHDAFFDRAGPRERRPDQDLLWVSRVMVLDDAAVDMAWLQAWTQDPLRETERIALGKTTAALRVGNSVVFDRCGEVAEASVLRALRLCNRFYAIAHVLSNNQRLVHARLLSEEMRIEQAAAVSESVRSHLDLLGHEYEDTLLGIQGLRRLAMAAYMQAWEFDKLIGTCQRRLGSVDALVQSALQRRNLRYTKLVEATLTLIGSVALLDFAVNLLNFSRSPEVSEDAVPGLVDLARLIPADGLLYVLMALIAYLVYGKLKR